MAIFCNISRRLLLVRNLNAPKLHSTVRNTAAALLLKTDTDNNGDNSKNYSQRHFRTPFGAVGVVLSASFFFSFFGKSDEDEETPEDKLITTIKRSILCIQRQQYDKAEQMLHLALRMAQDLQSKEGVTYIYDVMANLAMEREQFKKAEKLFADVMRRLLAEGHGEDSMQFLHISSKMARIAELQGEYAKAMQGFSWTLKKLEEKLRHLPEDKEIQELIGLTKNWYAQLLMKLEKYADAKKFFLEAYECLQEIHGKIKEEAITILNNISVACVNLEQYGEARKYLHEALDVVTELKDSTQEAIIQANLGLIYLQEGLVTQAREACSLAWRMGRAAGYGDAIDQAEYCLAEIKKRTE